MNVIESSFAGPESFQAAPCAGTERRPLRSFGDCVAISHEVDLATADILHSEVNDGIIVPGSPPEAQPSQTRARPGISSSVRKATAWPGATTATFFSETHCHRLTA